MGVLVKGASVIGSLLVLIALAITFLKTLIGFVGFLAFAIKILIVLVFVAVLAAVGFMVFRAWQSKKHQS